MKRPMISTLPWIPLSLLRSNPVDMAHLLECHPQFAGIPQGISQFHYILLAAFAWEAVKSFLYFSQTERSHTLSWAISTGRWLPGYKNVPTGDWCTLWSPSLLGSTSGTLHTSHPRSRRRNRWSYCVFSCWNYKLGEIHRLQRTRVCRSYKRHIIYQLVIFNYQELNHDFGNGVSSMQNVLHNLANIVYCFSGRASTLEALVYMFKFVWWVWSISFPYSFQKVLKAYLFRNGRS